MFEKEKCWFRCAGIGVQIMGHMVLFYMIEWIIISIQDTRFIMDQDVTNKKGKDQDVRQEISEQVTINILNTDDIDNSTKINYLWSLKVAKYLASLTLMMVILVVEQHFIYYFDLLWEWISLCWLGAPWSNSCWWQQYQRWKKWRSGYVWGTRWKGDN